jgi:hypothetical protein
MNKASMGPFQMRRYAIFEAHRENTRGGLVLKKA